MSEDLLQAMVKVADDLDNYGQHDLSVKLDAVIEKLATKKDWIKDGSFAEYCDKV